MSLRNKAYPDERARNIPISQPAHSACYTVFWEMFARVMRAYRRHGFANFCWLAVYNAFYAVRALLRLDRREDEFDLTYGTDTACTREIGSLDLRSENARHAVRYQATDADLFVNILSQLQLDFRSYSFLDYGCGKGKVLLLASHWPFKKIVGIEFSPELTRIAQQNINVYRGTDQQCTDMTVICCDAATYNPPTEPFVCYFYNPFGRPVMQRVIARLEQSLCDRQAAYIIYVDPQHSDIIEAYGAWKYLRSAPAYNIYCRADGKNS